MQAFRDLEVWQRAHKLTLSVYKLSANFPTEERYGLTSQIRRSAASVPTNLAEGCSRKTRPDFAHFINIAEGSAAETDYLLLLARDLGYASEETIAPLLVEATGVGRMLFSLRTKVEQS